VYQNDPTINIAKNQSKILKVDSNPPSPKKMATMLDRISQK
jgi:hypothetical protein